VRVVPGTALPQHVVDAIMAAAEQESPMPAAIRAGAAGPAMQPGTRAQASNVKVIVAEALQNHVVERVPITLKAPAIVTVSTDAALAPRPAASSVERSSAPDLDRPVQPASAKASDTATSTPETAAKPMDAPGDAHRQPHSAPIADADQPTKQEIPPRSDACSADASPRAPLPAAEFAVLEPTGAETVETVVESAGDAPIKPSSGTTPGKVAASGPSASSNAHPRAELPMRLPDNVAPAPKDGTTNEAGGGAPTDDRVGDTDSALNPAQAAGREAHGAVPAAQITAGGSVAAGAPSSAQPVGALLPPGAIPATLTAGAATAPASAFPSSFVAPPATATAGPAPDIDALAMAMAATSARGIKHFDIRLDPPELGRVDVHLSVGHDGKAEAHLTVDRPDTLMLLQRDSATLHRALRDAGLDLSNNSLNFSLKGQQRQGDGGGASTARTRSLPDAVVARAEAANASTPIWNHASDGARLDIRV
jgi:chemotaxis protein MotD